jgi:hypothetical protein
LALSWHLNQGLNFLSKISKSYKLNIKVSIYQPGAKLMEIVKDDFTETDPLNSNLQAEQLQPVNFNSAEPLADTQKKSEGPKKKLLMITEFAVLTWIGWLDPTVGFWISVVMLVWHLIRDKE